MEWLFQLLVPVAVVYGSYRVLNWIMGRAQGRRPAGDAPDEIDPGTLAGPLAEHFEKAAHPADLLQHRPFTEAAKRLAGSGRSSEELLGYAAGGNGLVACLALEAVVRRVESEGAAVPALVDRLLGIVSQRIGWIGWFTLRALARAAEEPVIHRVLPRLGPEWRDPFLLGALRDFVAQRKARGEPLGLAGRLRNVTPEAMETLRHLVTGLRDVAPELEEELARWESEHVDTQYLASVGRVWPAPEVVAGGPEEAELEAPLPDGIVSHPALVDGVGEILRVLTGESPRPILVVGDAGVGKSVLIRCAAARLQSDGWVVFEASAADVMAGQSFIGQLEDRIQKLLRQIGGKRVLWIAPGFNELAWAGRHSQSTTGVLDMILPHLEAGSIHLLGELRSQALEKLVQEQPRIRGVVETLRLPPMGSPQTLALARAWSEAHGPNAEPLLSEETLREAYQLASQYLGDRAPPGNLLHFLTTIRNRLRASGEERTITTEDLLVTLSRLTGLPLGILDERRGLDLGKLQRFFEARVMGQGEAVECLVERVAMIKAGLTDPTRPQGVFLFVGPTGTGKTEIAKALADYLFGSPDRMIRVDMSELQTPDSLDRLVGTGQAGSVTRSLVQEIRKEPFSVVLLDEFEKSHANVWDLFLQLFDDGRLTDRMGNTADFRHAIVILTSNLGASVAPGTHVGFHAETRVFSMGAVRRSLEATFRPEFLNRVDRVVIFRPLGRDVMRRILDKELADLQERRGLRNRAWAVEWEESAIEFLLEKGFTPELGARPLKRAIERYVLSPLAVAMVEHQVPEGDQFLFVRSDGEELQVEWVDPDAPDEEELAEADALLEGASRAGGPPGLREIALAARGVSEEVEALSAEYAFLEEVIRSQEWQGRKERALRAMAEPDFWDDPQRFVTLGRAEHMDRIEVGFETAGSLLGRLSPDGGEERDRVSPRLVRRLAERLYLIDQAVEALEAGRPADAFLRVAAAPGAADEPVLANAFARRIATMYRRWAEKRGMKLDVLEETESVSDRDAGEVPYHSILGLTGFGAFVILEHETGQHVLEVPDDRDRREFRRIRAEVRVAPQPAAPPRGSITLQAQAEEALGALDEESLAVIVRRYREEPSPLVRDGVAGWRTGRLDLVLAGDFDLFS